jgi:transcriptional regulator
LSEYEHRYKRPHQYKSKLVVDGTVDRVKKLKSEGKTFEEIGNIIGKTRQQASQIYYKAVANIH